MTAEILERAGTPSHPITVEKAPGPVTLSRGGTVLARTDSALILREAAYPPVYYLPKSAVDPAILSPAEKVTHCPYKGDAAHWKIALPGGVVADPGAWSYEEPIKGMSSIRGHLGFYLKALDAAFDPPAA